MPHATIHSIATPQEQVELEEIRDQILSEIASQGGGETEAYQTVRGIMELSPGAVESYLDQYSEEAEEGDMPELEGGPIELMELFRVMRPGRLVCVHSKDLPVYKNADGYAGMYDFTGDYHREMEKAGFKYHSKVTIWIDPVWEMRRTKTQRLLYKQLQKDSSSSGVGMPEYLTIFKKWDGPEDLQIPITNKDKENFPLETWQKWASPVWMDIDRKNVLNNYQNAKDQKDEKHIAPLQLDVIRRCIVLWSNPGEWVFDPFAGIGSTLYEAILNDRKGCGTELKDSYFENAKANIRKAISQKQQLTLV